MRGYPENPESIAEHIKKRRLDLRLSTRKAATRMGVSQSTVTDWETGRSSPAVRAIPAVIAFLGYDPYPAPQTEGERVRAKRRQLGLTRKGLADLLGVDQETVARWEGEEPKRPQRKRRLLMRRLLDYS